jgi:predicted secreted protein
MCVPYRFNLCKNKSVERTREKRERTMENNLKLRERARGRRCKFTVNTHFTTCVTLYVRTSKAAAAAAAAATKELRRIAEGRMFVRV